MESKQPESRGIEYLAKLIITAVYLGAFAFFIGWMATHGKSLESLNLGWLDLTALGLATYRMGHLISYDRVMEPIRSWFTDTVPDGTGAGDSVEPKGRGFQNVFGQLISCPICSGTWVAAGLVYARLAFPGPAQVLIFIMAAVGLAEFLNAAGEYLSWGGQYARSMSGAQAKAQQQQNHLQIVPLDEIEAEPLRMDTTVFSRRD